MATHHILSNPERQTELALLFNPSPHRQARALNLLQGTTGSLATYPCRDYPFKQSALYQLYRDATQHKDIPKMNDIAKQHREAEILAALVKQLATYPYERRGSAGWRYGVPCSRCGRVRWLRKPEAIKALKRANMCRGCSRLKNLKQYREKDNQ